jgi:hypothetical protein
MKSGEKSMYIRYKNNPCHIDTGDCVIRAISIITGMTWKKIYVELCVQGYENCGWGNENRIWTKYLKSIGFKQTYVNKELTVSEFAETHTKGKYVLGTGNHAVAVVDSNWIDSWDSGNEQVIYFFTESI